MSKGVLNTKKKVGLAFALLLASAMGAFAWSFTSSQIPVAGLSPSDPPHFGSATIRLSRIHTADIESRHGFSVRGASLTAPFTTAISAFVVEPWVSKRVADFDGDAVANELAMLHLLQDAADVTIVPAHDGRVHEAIPEWPEMSD